MYVKILYIQTISWQLLSLSKLIDVAQKDSTSGTAYCVKRFRLFFLPCQMDGAQSLENCIKMNPRHMASHRNGVGGFLSLKDIAFK